MLKNEMFDKKVTEKLRKKILEYITKNNLGSYICEHLYYAYQFKSQKVAGRSNAVDWLNSYQLDYTIKYYYDHTLVFKRDEGYVYDEYDYLGEPNGCPIRFDERYNIEKTLLSIHFEKYDISGLIHIARKLGLTDTNIQDLLNEAYIEQASNERLEGINKLIGEITYLRNNLKNIEKSLRNLSSTLDEPFDDKVLDLQSISEKVNKHIEQLESEIESERSSVLTLRQ